MSKPPKLGHWFNFNLCVVDAASREKINNMRSLYVTATTIAKPPMAMAPWMEMCLSNEKIANKRPTACMCEWCTYRRDYRLCNQIAGILCPSWAATKLRLMAISPLFRWSNTMNQRRSLCASGFKPTNKDLQHWFRRCHETVRWHYWPLLLQRETWLTVRAPHASPSHLLRYWFGTVQKEREKLLLSSRSIIWTRFSI